MKLKLFSIIFFFIICVNLSSQISNQQLNGREDEANVITTAVPFLTIAPDSRSGAMGDAGVGTTPDVNAQHHNPAKYPFIKKDYGLAISYSPWLRQLVNDINLAYITGYYKFANTQAISGSLRYFSLGDITFTNMQGEVTGQHKPNEFAIDIAYSRLLAPTFSLAVALRYINSNLTGGYSGGGVPTHVGQAASSDIAIFYTKSFEIKKKQAEFCFGTNFSNIGSKMSYTDNSVKDFLPMMLRIGPSLKINIDDYNSLLGTFEFSKLLVPTPPVYYVQGDTMPNGQIAEASGKYIKYGKDPNISVPVAIFQSFWDAPGVQMDPLNPDDRSRFREELREINYSIGVEYTYANQFTLRSGYFYEHPTKGNRKFFTIGAGLKLKIFSIDFSYLIPVHQNHPLANTLRFTLMFNFETEKEKQPNK